MSTPISADWLRTAERDGTVKALAAGAQPFLESLNEPTRRFEAAKKGGTYVSVVVEALQRVARKGKVGGQSGAQEDAKVATFWLETLAGAAAKGPG